MQRQVNGISAKTAHDLCAEVPRIGMIEHHIGDDLCSLILDDNVIIKVYDDCVVFDLGGIKEFLSEEDFESITIR